LGVDAVIADNVIKVKKGVINAAINSTHPSDTSFFVERSVSHHKQ